MKRNRKPRKKFIHLSQFLTKLPGAHNAERIVSLINDVGKTECPMPKNEIRPIFHGIYKKKKKKTTQNGLKT
jgi:hypothetical protein